MKHKMISGWVLVAIALLALGALVTGVVLASAERGSSDQLDATKSTGGRYQLTTTSSPADAAVSGGDYRLLLPTPVVDPAAGCCCKTNLPCVLRQ